MADSDHAIDASESKRREKMRIAVLLMASPMLGGTLFGCTVNAPSCPSTTVVLDAAGRQLHSPGDDNYIAPSVTG
jgi:hypothetical protein